MAGARCSREHVIRGRSCVVEAEERIQQYEVTGLDVVRVELQSERQELFFVNADDLLEAATRSDGARRLAIELKEEALHH